jgi:hypothetical protein
MKLGIIGTGNVGCAIALAAVTPAARVNRARQPTGKSAEALATDIRCATPLCPKVRHQPRRSNWHCKAGPGRFTTSVPACGRRLSNKPLRRVSLCDFTLAGSRSLSLGASAHESALRGGHAMTCDVRLGRSPLLTT